MKMYLLASLLLFQALACKQASESSQAFYLPDSLQLQKRDTAETSIIVFRSADGGQTWQDISAGLPKPVMDDKGVGRKVSFANDSGLFLADGNGLYHSERNATAPFWTKAFIPDEHSSITPVKTGILAYNNDGHILQRLAGTDKWLPIYTTFEQKRVHSVFESAAGSIFIASDDGLFKSTNNGKTWKRVYTGGGVFNLVESRGVLMAISGIGVIRSADDGEAWNFVVNEERRGFVVDSIKGGFAVIFDRTASDSRKVQTSYDGGKTWQPIDEGLPASYSIASFMQVGEAFFCSHPDGIYKSSDKGKTWKLILPSVYNKVFNLAVSGNVIYALPRRRGC